MCEFRLVVLENGEEKVIDSNIAYLDLERMEAVKLGGERISLKGYQLKAIDFLNHKILTIRVK
ncbi:MAG TPA: CooT family nickel-binding protein [Pyrodictium sp.]|nr:CooT family nickel-binding protein [Pyrodictium sp.]